MPAVPALFVGHGSPMNTLETNPYTRAWRTLSRSIPPPRGILAISAHWYIGATAVTATQRPLTIHDFYGFSDELFAFDYPALISCRFFTWPASRLRPARPPCRWCAVAR